MSRTRNDATVPAPGAQVRRHDQTYKRIFQHRVAVLALLRLLARGWFSELDQSTIKLDPTENVGADLARRLCDAAWRVWFKNSDRSVIFLVEFQSSGDPAMALRTLRYSETVYDAIRANPALRDPGGAVPLVLSYVVNTGAQRWTAETSVAGLVREDELPPSVVRATAGLGTTHRHAVVDLQSSEVRQLIPDDNILGWLAAMEQDPWDSFPTVYEHLASQWAGAEHDSVREAFAAWTAERLRAAGVPAAETQIIFDQIIDLQEEMDMGRTYTEWAEGHRQTGREQGLEQGRRTMVVRQASRRFGTQTAKALAEMVRSMGPEQLDQVGDAVVDCETGDELLAQAANGA